MVGDTKSHRPVIKAGHCPSSYDSRRILNQTTVGQTWTEPTSRQLGKHGQNQRPSRLVFRYIGSQPDMNCPAAATSRPGWSEDLPG